MITRRIWRKWWAWAAVVATLPIPVLVPLRWAVIDEVRSHEERIELLRAELQLRHGTAEPRLAAIASEMHEMGEAPASREQAAWSATRYVYGTPPSPHASAAARELDLLALGAIEPLLEEWSLLAHGGAQANDLIPNFTVLQTLPKALPRAGAARLSTGDIEGAARLLEASMLLDQPLRGGPMISSLIAVSMRATSAVLQASLLKDRLDPAFEEQLLAMQAGAWSTRPFIPADCHWRDSVEMANLLAGGNVPDGQAREAQGNTDSLLESSLRKTRFLRGHVAKQLHELGEAEESARFLRGEDPGPFYFLQGSGAWTAPRFLRAQLRDLNARRPDLVAQLAVPLPESLAAHPESWLASIFLTGEGVLHEVTGYRSRLMSTQSALAMAAYATRVHHSRTGEWPESIEALSPELQALLQPMLDEASNTPPLEGAPLAKLLTREYQGPIGPIRIARRPLTRETAPAWAGLLPGASAHDTTIEFSQPADPATGHQRGEMTITLVGGSNSLEGAVAALDAMGTRDAIAGWDCAREATFEWGAHDRDAGNLFVPSEAGPDAKRLTELILGRAMIPRRDRPTGRLGMTPTQYRLSFTVALPDAPLAVWSPGPDGVDDGALRLHSFEEELKGKGDLVVWPEPR